MSDQSVQFKPSDGTYAKIILGCTIVAGIGAVYGVYILLPFLIKLATNLVWLGIEVGVLLFLGLSFLQLLLSKDSIYYKMKLLARDMRKRVATENPVSTIDVSIGIMDTKLDEIGTHQISANGALERLKNKIRNREKTGLLDLCDRETSLADAAEKMQRPELEVQQHTVAAARAKKGAESIQPMIDDQEFIKGQLEKAKEVAVNALADFKSQRAVLSVQYEAARESMAQAKAFKKFFGKNTELEMIDFAVDAIEQQTTDTRARIEQLMSQLTPRIQAAQLAHEAEVAEAMQKRLEAKQLAEKPSTLTLPSGTSSTVNVQK